jgi:hypothetical protein
MFEERPLADAETELEGLAPAVCEGVGDALVVLLSLAVVEGPGVARSSRGENAPRARVKNHLERLRGRAQRDVTVKLRVLELVDSDLSYRKRT